VLETLYPFIFDLKKTKSQKTEMSVKIKKRFLIIILSTLLFAGSCSDEPDLSNPVPRGGDEEDEPGFLSIDIDTRAGSGLMTRAEGDLLPGEGAENRVGSLRVVLYDIDGVVRYSKDYTSITSDGETLPDHADILDHGTASVSTPGASNFQLEAMEVTQQEYRLLVLANPTEAVKNVTETGDSIDDLTEAATVSMDELTGEAGFFMSNHQDLVAVPLSRIHNTASAAEDDAVEVRIDRGVAKIGVVRSSKFDGTSGGRTYSVELQAWGLDVTNRSMYWTRRMTDKVTAGVVSPEVYGDPRVNIYAEDPNFEAFSLDAWNDADQSYDRASGDPSDYFHYTDAGGVDNPIGTLAEPSFDYALENTMVATEQWQDVTTSVIVRAEWRPRISSLGSPIGTDDPYFVYRGMVLTAQNIDDMIAAETIEKDLLTHFPQLAGLAADLTAVRDGEGPLACPDGFATLELPEQSVKDGPLAFNADGVNYYRIPIRHFGDAVQPNMMALGRFGVVRNNVYELTINSLNGPGDIDIPTPDDPDENTLGYVAGTIFVYPWLLRNYDTDLGEWIDHPEGDVYGSTIAEIYRNPPTTP
jgi:hypothetical protein